MKYLLVISWQLLTITSIFGQTLHGRITNKRGQPVENAYIIISSNPKAHAHSDANGQFTIPTINLGDTLQLSHVGYDAAMLIIDNIKEELAITLQDKIFTLDELVVSPQIDAIHLLADINIQTNPVNNSQEILRKVPGLVIGQHAGGGKAEQIFLRGVDNDHGTDFNITVEGLPVNMVSHAHGQGYADLHFVIPETIERLDFGKGPYYADHGDFTTTGYVNFLLKEKLDQSQIKLELGQFNSQRVLGMFNLLNNDHRAAYISSEYIYSDGPFVSPQNFNRLNLFGRFTSKSNNLGKFSLIASYFTSKWDASGQIPQRAVDNGTISRFGAIDDTEGGNTSRANLLFEFTKPINARAFIKNTGYFSYYDFELYSNFTFFLKDSINGDQIRQKEKRRLFGITSVYNQSFKLKNANILMIAGGGLRYDFSKNNELSHTVNRIITLQTLQLGDITETNLFAYLDLTYKIGKWSFNPSIRFDEIDFSYNDHLQVVYQTQTASKSIISPKFNILYNYSPALQLYVKAGKGFHSNDTRVVIKQKAKEILPAAYGTDAGFIWKPTPKIIINTALWYLFLEQEFVYVGDEAIVEPKGKTRRFGLDLSLRHQLLSWLFWDIDINYAWARFIDLPTGKNFIPLAPRLTFLGGVNALFANGFYAGLRLRYLNDRPANEDNSIIASGYAIADFNSGYQWKNFNVEISIQNIFNSDWNETQFATESRLKDELNPIEEIHFTPGTPFNLKGSIAYKF